MNLTALRGLAMPLVMSTFVSATSLFFNGSLDAAQSTVADASRDWATSFQAIEMIVLALVARYAPHAIRNRRISAICLAAVVVGVVCAGWGTVRANPIALTLGVCLSSTCAAWTTIVWLVSCSALPFRHMFVCIVLGDLLAIPLFSLLAHGGHIFSLACYALALGIPLMWCAKRTDALFDAFAQSEAAADAEVTRPSSVLPLTHDLFIYILAFCSSYGFALRYQQADGHLLSSWFIALVLAGVAIWGLARHEGPRVDGLFSAAFTLLLGGFLLVLLDDASLALPASIALASGSSVFDLLMTLALCAIAARSQSNALPALAWGQAARYAGIELGAQLGILVTDLANGQHVLGQACVAGILAAVTLYTVFSIRDFGFDKTIAGIEPGKPPTVVVEVQYTDRIEARCNELAVGFGLTERETDVFRLLARGNNTLRIQEELAITKNTLKYHARHIYEKAGVHSQQELIDLL